jgi:hypothetical protein
MLQELGMETGTGCRQTQRILWGDVSKLDHIDERLLECVKYLSGEMQILWPYQVLIDVEWGLAPCVY